MARTIQFTLNLLALKKSRLLTPTHLNRQHFPGDDDSKTHTPEDDVLLDSRDFRLLYDRAAETRDARSGFIGPIELLGFKIVTK